MAVQEYRVSSSQSGERVMCRRFTPFVIRVIDPVGIRCLGFQASGHFGFARNHSYDFRSCSTQTARHCGSVRELTKPSFSRRARKPSLGSPVDLLTATALAKNSP